MGDEVQTFEEYLRKHSLHLTSPRRTVLQKVFSTQVHFTADELIAQLDKDGTPVSKATVYRTLALLRDCNLLIEHDFGIGKAYYEHASALEHHGHFYCVDCGNIAEFYDARLNAMQEKISQQEGFQPVQFVVKIHGYCPVCQSKRARHQQGSAS
ncbi:MAG: transcriptional repressor [Planctomycetes bacterium]|nr:transcriptional repressor [Planctomycetota bacterium]